MIIEGVCVCVFVAKAGKKGVREEAEERAVVRCCAPLCKGKERHLRQVGLRLLLNTLSL